MTVVPQITTQHAARQPPRRAFTLVELLIVIAVMAVLVGILMPSLSGARKSAASLNCQANLRQWSQAVVMYAHDNESWLPRRGQGAQATTQINRTEDWFNALPPFLGEMRYSELFERGQTPRPGAKLVWMCPAAAESDSLNYFAYGMNMRLSTWQAPLPDRIDNVAPTDRQVFLSDGPGPHCSVLPAAQPYSANARHAGNVNIAFLDGHAASFGGEYVGCGRGDPLRGDVQWRVPNSVWEGPSQ